jgi:hypothetical protein
MEKASHGFNQDEILLSGSESGYQVKTEMVE